MVHMEEGSAIAGGQSNLSILQQVAVIFPFITHIDEVNSRRWIKANKECNIQYVQ